ncbi:unnamed protein product [Clonostachys rosea]|uniref:Heterokaryon incompatibility domain-containing protein n=1 Tax=Bionectria ochroleuca TaxID=29856 RepID=A0ABY6TSV5_BIOOC|nr:unnamed protein product [Clonostachys rosea]
MDVLQKGKEKRDPFPILLPPQWGTNLQGAVHEPSENCLQETIRVLWRNISDNKEQILRLLPGISAFSRDMMLHDNASLYADIVYICITPAARRFMASGRFNPRDLHQLPAVSATYPRQAGIYVIIYGDFNGRTWVKARYETAIYVGQTIQFQARARFMIPIVLEQGSNLPDKFLDIAEFTMLYLFKSWYFGLFAPSNMNLVGSYGIDFEAAQIFATIMRTTSQSTGWNPEQLYGLNWNTPLIRNQKALQKWVYWYDTERETYFYRSKRVICSDHRDGSKSFVWTGSQSVDVVVEIHKDSYGHYKTHPFRFVRLPRIGRNPELEKLASLAVKLEWFADNQWRAAYLDRRNIWRERENADGHLKIHHKALMMSIDVEKISYINRPQWLPQRPTSIVQFLRYDRLEQRLVVEKVQPRQLQGPANNTIAQNTQRIRDLYTSSQLNDTHFGVRPDNMLHRKLGCDICVSQGTPSDYEMYYDRARQTCGSCFVLRRSCTFTKIVRPNKHFVRAFGGLDELGIAVNLSRISSSVTRTLVKAPFDANLADEESDEENDGSRDEADH